MNAKFLLLLCLAVMLLTAIEDSNAFASNPLDVSDEELDRLLKSVEDLEQVTRQREDAFAKRALRTSQAGAPFGMSGVDWEELINTLEQLVEVLQAELGKTKRRR